MSTCIGLALGGKQVEALSKSPYCFEWVGNSTRFIPTSGIGSLFFLNLDLESDEGIFLPDSSTRLLSDSDSVFQK